MREWKLCHPHSHPTSCLGVLRPSLSPACPMAALISQDGKVWVLLSWTPEGLQGDSPHPRPPGPV